MCIVAVKSKEEQIKTDIQAIYDLMAKNRVNIASLRNKLRTANTKIDGLEKMITGLQAQISVVWCQIDNERKTDNQFISLTVSKEMLAIQQLTMEWLGFDIIQKREHIGGITQEQIADVYLSI